MNDSSSIDSSWPWRHQQECSTHKRFFPTKRYFLPLIFGLYHPSSFNQIIKLSTFIVENLNGPLQIKSTRYNCHLHPFLSYETSHFCTEIIYYTLGPFRNKISRPSSFLLSYWRKPTGIRNIRQNLILAIYISIK